MLIFARMLRTKFSKKVVIDWLKIFLGGGVDFTYHTSGIVEFEDCKSTVNFLCEKSHVGTVYIIK